MTDIRLNLIASLGTRAAGAIETIQWARNGRSTTRYVMKWMTWSRVALIVLCAGELIMSRPAEANIIKYTNRAAWVSALSGAGYTCEDFETEALPPFGTQPTPYTTAANTLLTTITPPAVTIQYLNPGLLGSGELHFRDFTHGVRFTIPVVMSAFGFDYDMGPDKTGDNMTLTGSGVPTVLPYDTVGFIGYIDTTGSPIPFFDLVGGPGPQGGISVDNLCHSAWKVVGANKDFQNNTGTTVNDFEWLIQGSYSSVNSHYDGPYPNQANSTFSNFSITPSGPNTLLRWSGTASIPPGGFAHVGFTVIGTNVSTLGASWTINGVFAGCAHQVSIGSGYSHLLGGTVSFANTATDCESITLYVGNVTLEWFTNEVPLTELNAGGTRFPIRTDVIPGAPVAIPPNGEPIVSIPSPPAGANFAMIQFTVSADSALSGPGNTVDFIQLPLPNINHSPNRCLATKNKCVSKKMQGLLKCHNVAEKSGVAVDPACIQKAKDKFDGGTNPAKGCFAKAEAKNDGPCQSLNDTTPLENKVDAFVNDVVTELDPSFPTPIQNDCSAGKKKCVLKKTAGVMKCHEKAAKGGFAAPDPACVNKAIGKFGGFCDGGANADAICHGDSECPGSTCEKGCFTKLEAKGGCITLGDSAALEDKVDAFVQDVLCELGYTTLGCS